MSEVVFVLQTEEVKCAKSTLTKNSSYFSDLLQSSDSYSEVRITLPEWVSRPPLDACFEYLSTRNVPKVDMLTAQKTLWLSDLFQCPDLAKEVVETIIVPALNRDNVVHLLGDAYAKLQQQDSAQHWQTLLRACVLLTAKHAQYIFDKFKPVILTLQPALVEQLCFVFLLDNARKAVSDYTPVLEALREVRKALGFVSFLLREHEQIVRDKDWRDKAQEVFQWTAELVPGITESSVFEFVGCHWTVSLNCQNESVEVALRNVTQDQPLNWPKHSIICLSVAAQLGGSEVTPVVVSAIAGTKTHNIIDCRPIDSERRELQVRLFAQMEPLYSALLTHIARFPTSTLGKESMRGFPTDKLLVIMKYKYLSVRNEDEVLDIVGRWSANHFPTVAAAELELSPVLASIKWDFVTLKGLFRTAASCSTLRQSQVFQNIFKREISLRAGLKNFRDVSDRPRFSYKHELTKEVFQTEKSFLDGTCEALFEQQFTPLLPAVTPTQDSAEYLQDGLRLLSQREEKIRELQARMQQLKREETLDLTKQEDLSMQLSPLLNQLMNEPVSLRQSRKPSIDLGTARRNRTKQIFENMISDIRKRLPSMAQKR